VDLPNAKHDRELAGLLRADGLEALKTTLQRDLEEELDRVEFLADRVRRDASDVDQMEEEVADIVVAEFVGRPECPSSCRTALRYAFRDRAESPRRLKSSCNRPYTSFMTELLSLAPPQRRHHERRPDEKNSSTNKNGQRIALPHTCMPEPEAYRVSGLVQRFRRERQPHVAA
jgi:hypothetical protein